MNYKYIDVFLWINEKFDDESFMDLTEEYLRKLNIKFGPPMKLLKLITKMKEEESMNNVQLQRVKLIPEQLTRDQLSPKQLRRIQLSPEQLPRVPLPT